MEANENPRPITIRVNTLKTSRSELIKQLENKQVQIEPMNEFCKTCFKINASKISLGSSVEYLGGHYML